MIDQKNSCQGSSKSAHVRQISDRVVKVIEKLLFDF